MKPPPPRRIAIQILATAGALLLANAALSFTHYPWLLPSFGGSCVILFGMPRGIMAQPRSFFGGRVYVGQRRRPIVGHAGISIP